MRTKVRYLLDTNVLSETRARRPNACVAAFLAAVEEDSLFLSVLSLGELRKGLALRRKAEATAANGLATWIDLLEESFSDRILGIDTAVANLWGELSATRSRPVIDTLLAATAIVHDLTLVTRNIRDVQDTKAKLLNPWNED